MDGVRKGYEGETVSEHESTPVGSVMELGGDFDRARVMGFIHRLLHAITHRSSTLDAWSGAKVRLGGICRGTRYGRVYQVCLDRITGSVDRTGEFDHHFYPLRRNSRARWESIDRAMYWGQVLPPVQLYKLGDRYFVLDGHHRVSVARYRGMHFVDAEVIEYPVGA